MGNLERDPFSRRASLLSPNRSLRASRIAQSRSQDTKDRRGYKSSEDESSDRTGCVDYVYRTYVVGGLQNLPLSEKKIQYLAKIGGASKGRTLVVGFAVTAELRALSKSGHRVLGVDRDIYAVRVAKETGCEVARCDVDRERLPFREGSFDSVFALHVIEHLKRPISFVSEIHSILKPGGVLILETPDYEFWGPVRFYADKTHKTPFTMSSLRQVLETAFDRIQTRRLCPAYVIWRFTDLAFGAINPLNLGRTSLVGIARRGRMRI